MRVVKFMFLALVFFTSVALITVSPPPPPGPIGAFANGVFPSTVPGEGSSWEMEDIFPDLEIPSPLRIIEMPGSSDLLVLSKIGQVWLVSTTDQSKKKVLDVTDRCQGVGESGVTGIALHPKFGNPAFPDKQVGFVFYPAKLNPQAFEEKLFLRLSKFEWDESNQEFDNDSEEILMQQYDRWSWHNGGGMFFDEKGFFYFGIGDEGHNNFQAVSTQRLDGGMFSGIFRIDVDKDPTRSHPIRRQPLPNDQPELPRYADWDTYTQGYYIPNDNPWLSSDSSHLEEYFAIGCRSPYSLSYDMENQQIWLADVGSHIREEIDKVDKADNLQWPFAEGNLLSETVAKPEQIIGNEKGPFFDYERAIGSCIIGGSVYRGNVFPNLNGKYLYADYGVDKLWALKSTSGDSTTQNEILLNGLSSPDIVLPEGPGISGIHAMKNGDIYLTIIGKDPFDPSKIVKLKQKSTVADPPSKLSELGIFNNLDDLIPVDGFIPYQVNSPLWSDRAIKQRWMSIPSDGSFNTNQEKIKFSAFNDWEFPVGTVFIKHFELPITTDLNGPTKRLETRFFVLGEGEIGYGLSYKWNDDGTEAYLTGGASSKDFDIMEDGQVQFTQTWDFPGRDQCMTCHTSNANFVLGVKTHQLNGEMEYLGTQMNQISYIKSHNIFSNPSDANTSQLKAYPIDDESADLGVRVRSYLDANCASCHRPAGVHNVDMDLRFTTPLELQNIIKLRTKSENSNLDNYIVEPGDHASSELWIRDAKSEGLKMPPLARNLVDEVYIEKLAEWIDGLSDEAGEIEALVLYPNPNFGHLFIQMKREWEPPFPMEMYNVAGQLVLNENMESHTKYIDLNAQPSGIYFIRIEANGEQYMEKIILER